MFHHHVWKAQALGSLGPLSPMVAETMEELEKRLAALEKAMEEEAAGSGLSELRFAKFLDGVLDGISATKIHRMAGIS